MSTWLTPTIDADRRIVEPAELAGLHVVSVLAQTCNEPHPGGFGTCGLVRNHDGRHWNCSPELVAEAGPFALVREVGA